MPCTYWSLAVARAITFIIYCISEPKVYGKDKDDYRNTSYVGLFSNYKQQNMRQITYSFQRLKYACILEW